MDFVKRRRVFTKSANRLTAGRVKASGPARQTETACQTFEIFEWRRAVVFQSSAVRANPAQFVVRFTRGVTTMR